jgi:hypothetical protein
MAGVSNESAHAGGKDVGAKAKAFVVGQVNPKLAEFKHPFLLAIFIGIPTVAFTCSLAHFITQDCQKVHALLPMSKVSGSSGEYTCERVQAHWTNTDSSFAGAFGTGVDKTMIFFESLNGTFDESSSDVGFDCDVLQPMPQNVLHPAINKAGEAWFDFPCEGCGCVDSSGLECNWAQDVLECCKPGEPKCFTCDAYSDSPRDDCSGPSPTGQGEDSCVLAGFTRDNFPDKKHWTYSYHLERTVGDFNYDIRMNVVVGTKDFPVESAVIRSMGYSTVGEHPGWAGSTSCCKSRAGSGTKNCMNARANFYEDPAGGHNVRTDRMLSMLMSAQRSEAFPEMTRNFFYGHALYCESDVCLNLPEAVGMAMGYAGYVEAALTVFALLAYGFATGQWGRESINKIMDAVEP